MRSTPADEAICITADTSSPERGRDTPRPPCRHRPSSSPSPSPLPSPPILALPPELVDAILCHLSPYDLAALSATCHALRQYALSDIHWLRCVQDNVPAVKVTSPGPCADYRELYAAHDRLWFLPKFKVWFCDRDLTGKLIVARYDPRRGCIEAYQLIAVSTSAPSQHWHTNHGVVVHDFEPQVRLHLDKPVLRFRVRDGRRTMSLARRPDANRFADEMPLALEDRLVGMFSNFLLTRPLDPEEIEARLSSRLPSKTVWPPPAIPARQRVSGARPAQSVTDLASDHRPRRRSQVSNQIFRIRQWIELAGTPALPSLMGRAGGLAGTVQLLIGGEDFGDGSLGPVGAGFLGPHIGEEIITYSTLDPALYKPTPTKPWRGIWVGDYSGHGCEFVLVSQPDDPPATDEELGLVRGEDELDEAWERRRRDARIYRGRLEGIKLTGDPNVPRGEYTFIADDLGPGGHFGTATEPPFSGARVVHSRGHIAATGFINDKFIESRLILMGPDRLAQHWVEFGHISFFERVHIDDFLAP